MEPTYACVSKPNQAYADAFTTFDVTLAYDPNTTTTEQLPIECYIHLRHKPQEKIALSMLKEIARVVQPLMTQRGYKLESLCEFWPYDRPALTGQHWTYADGSHRIFIRLREFHDQTVFRALEDCVHTMLHELAHFVHDDHNEEFWTLFYESLDEYRATHRSGPDGGPYAGTKLMMRKGAPFNNLICSMSCGVEREPGEVEAMEHAARSDLWDMGYRPLEEAEETRPPRCSLGDFVQWILGRCH